MPAHLTRIYAKFGMDFHTRIGGLPAQTRPPNPSQARGAAVEARSPGKEQQAVAIPSARGGGGTARRRSRYTPTLRIAVGTAAERETKCITLAYLARNSREGCGAGIDENKPGVPSGAAALSESAARSSG